jgi:pilus assembly protein CpaC
MAPCLVAVLALSGAARSGASPQEAHAPSQEANTTVTTPSSPKTRISKETAKAIAAPQAGAVPVPLRPTTPSAYGNGDLRALPAALSTPAEATVSAVSLGLPAESKVIAVQQLQLPPASKPLPGWMQKAVVSADEPNINQAALSKQDGKSTLERLAQLPSAKPALGGNYVPKAASSLSKLPNQITVASSTYIVLMANTDLQTVAVADPAIADVSVVNARAVLVNGKSAGTTTLVIVDKVGKIRQYDVKVTPAPGARPEDIENAIGIGGVRVRQLRDTIVLEGQVESSDEVHQAVQIAGIYAPKVLNLLHVQGALSGPEETAAEIQNAINQPDVHVSMLSDTAILQGTVPTLNDSAKAEQVAKLMAPKVLNLLQLPPLTVDQVKDALGVADQTPAFETLDNGSYGAVAPKPYLTIRQADGQLILEGYEPADYDLDGALALASRSGLQVINHIRLAPENGPDQKLLNTIAAAIGMPSVHVRGTAKRVILEGTVPDTNAAVTAGQIALSYASDVDNMLQTSHPIQVNVDVSLVEITKSGIKSLGINAPGLFESTPGFGGGLNLGNVGFGPGQATTLGTSLGLQLRAAIDKGDAHMLSNPRSTVLSGRTASFQAGGQAPIPTSISQDGTGNTLVQIEYKNFGVMMDVTPIANPDGTVTMRVRTDVTQIDPTLAQNIGQGISVPGFTRRAATTEVTVPAGGSIALSGLIQNVMHKYAREIPLLSKIPVLGKLFSSTRYENDQSDLVIFVTPRVLPNPLTDGGTAPAAVTAVGPNTTTAVTLGNAGFQSFDSSGSSGGGNSGGGNGGGGGSTK